MVNVSLEVVASLVGLFLVIHSGIIAYLYRQVKSNSEMVEGIATFLFGPERAEGGGLKEDFGDMEEEHEGLKNQLDDVQSTVDDIKDTVNGDYGSDE